MKVNFSKLVTDLDGAPLKAEGKTMTIGSAIITALLAPGAAERPSAESSGERFRLAQKVHASTSDNEIAVAPGEITVEEAALIKKLVGALFAPIVYGRVAEAIEGGSD